MRGMCRRKTEVSRRAEKLPIHSTDRDTVPKDVFHGIFTLFLLTQSRSTNIPLYLLLRTQRSILALMPLSCVELTVTLILSQYTTFFAFGGSNAISSVDLSSGYNGVSSYNASMVGILTFLTNWAGPVWWISASHTIHSHRTAEADLKHDSILTIHTSLSLLSVMVACTVLRAHLFIWTVFSPKLLYSMAWTLGHHLLVNFLMGRLLSFL
jgi:ethanolaminephosphotransferase